MYIMHLLASSPGPLRATAKGPSRPIALSAHRQRSLRRSSPRSTSYATTAPGPDTVDVRGNGSSAPPEVASLSLWSGSDAFSPLGDRCDAPPPPLPHLARPVRVVIVRHGQSTWNAEGRIQGSTDLSVLTDKGVKQAQRARDMLSGMSFDAVFQSPLARARQTADAILQRHPAFQEASARTTEPSLREVDLYSFQGLLKHEGKALYGEQYKQWQKAPESFQIDGHAPVRELWYRGGLAWQRVLGPGAAGPEGAPPAGPSPLQLLVVAHNAINQALVATALGLPPRYFRRLPQNNAALSIFDFAPAPGGCGPPAVDLVCLNQSPDNPFKNPDKVVGHVVLLTLPGGPGPEAAAPSVSRGAALGALAGVLSKLQVTHVLAAQGAACDDDVSALLAGQPQAAAIAAAAPSRVPLEVLAGPTVSPAAMWRRAVELAALPQAPDSGKARYGNVVVLLDERTHAGVLWAALGVEAAEGSGARLRVSPGGLSVVEFADDPAATPATVRCINNTAHLHP